MITNEMDRSRCSVAGTLAVVGEKWSLLVLREAFLGVRRFADFQRNLEVSRAVLTDRLATFVEQGVLTRVPYHADGQRERHEYRLTTKGLDLYPTVVALMEWGDRYLGDGQGGPIALQHRDCGAPVRLALVCDDDHRLDGAYDVEATVRPRGTGRYRAIEKAPSSHTHR
ncbi:winged helix-turn-helix transcriptional regulator [Nocardioides daejeonensis]|uniref:winged helix-turn-helix transcriptional regulator n=1 Tax=Nocardioides daejeonensis TaxID=1046556 RepID=UPI00194E259D|nr:helix-turn-helix domain-containing protein [Nocardioides daejeonensis]